jgi:hypothetical protein
LSEALQTFRPRLRGVDARLPFVLDAQTLHFSEILTLVTDAGDIGLLAGIKGIGNYANVETLSETVLFEGLPLRVLSIEGLILSKRAAARPKDEAVLIELEALREAGRFGED